MGQRIIELAKSLPDSGEVRGMVETKEQITKIKEPLEKCLSLNAGRPWPMHVLMAIANIVGVT